MSPLSGWEFGRDFVTSTWQISDSPGTNVVNFTTNPPFDSDSFLNRDIQVKFKLNLGASVESAQIFGMTSYERVIGQGGESFYIDRATRDALDRIYLSQLTYGYVNVWPRTPFTSKDPLVRCIMTKLNMPRTAGKKGDLFKCEFTLKYLDTPSF